MGGALEGQCKKLFFFLVRISAPLVLYMTKDFFFIEALPSHQVQVFALQNDDSEYERNVYVYLSEGPCLGMHPAWIGFTQHKSHILATGGRS